MRCTGGSAQKGSNKLEPIIRIEQLTHTYSAGTPFQRSAVDGVELDIMPGEFLGVIGHTGSGKSTLIQHLNGLLKASSGAIYYNGENIYGEGYDMRALRSKVGLVFQYPEHQLFEVSVIEDVKFGPKNLGLDNLEVEMRSFEALKMVGIGDDLLDASPFALSGGQKRRVAIAGVLAMKPECIVLDEATAMLDPIGRREVLAAVEKLNREQGITVVLITHHMNEAEHADRVIVMNDGLVVMDGKPREVFTRKKELEDIGLAVPDTVSLLFSLREAGMDVPVDAITVEECADAIAKNFT